MKKTTPFIALIVCLMLLFSCQSKEKKAAKLIEKELSKTLYDFESYQPVETTLTEAKLTMYNDTTCWRKAEVLADCTIKSNKNFEDAKLAQGYMDIWGPPSYYSTTYSDKQYYKYKEEYETNIINGVVTFKVCYSIAKELQEMIAQLDTTKVIGWEVNHLFRCKTRGGLSTIGKFRYVIDKDFEHILIQEDLDDTDKSHIRSTLQYVAENDLDEPIDYQ